MKENHNKYSKSNNDFSTHHLKPELVDDFKNFTSKAKLRENSELYSPMGKPEIDNLLKIETHISQNDFISKFKSYIKLYFDDLILHDIIEENYSNGSLYIGQKRHGMKNGKGLFKYCNSSIYIGEWRENTMTGFGTLFNDQGQIIYKGDWKNDKFHGRGALYHPSPHNNENEALIDYNNFNTAYKNWVKYEGEFVLDMKEGHGVLYFQNGDIYEGKFKCDKIDGEGWYENKHGKRFQGVWENNYLIA